MTGIALGTLSKSCHYSVLRSLVVSCISVLYLHLRRDHHFWKRAASAQLNLVGPDTDLCIKPAGNERPVRVSWERH